MSNEFTFICIVILPTFVSQILIYKSFCCILVCSIFR